MVSNSGLRAAPGVAGGERIDRARSASREEDAPAARAGGRPDRHLGNRADHGLFLFLRNLFHSERAYPGFDELHTIRAGNVNLPPMGYADSRKKGRVHQLQYRLRCRRCLASTPLPPRAYCRSTAGLASRRISNFPTTAGSHMGKPSGQMQSRPVLSRDGYSDVAGPGICQ